MVGGGPGAFIGAVHRNAGRLDGELELVCGAFSSHADKSRAFGAELGLPAERSYPDYPSMLRGEARRPADERMQFVAIVTPNVSHYPIASTALAHGFHVLSDKPATVGLDECVALAKEVEESGLLYGLTHPYTAYPMIAEARRRVAAAELGTVRKVLVEYTQGWLAGPVDNVQARWRLDPSKGGPSGCMGDIGVHAFNLAEHVAGVLVTAICATLNRVVAGRVLDDDGAVFLEFDNGATGSLVASQVCTGDENELRLRVYGDKASLDWRQPEPNTLTIKRNDGPTEVLRTGMPYVGGESRALARVPPGHPEGYIEAFANLYRVFAGQVRAVEAGVEPETAVPGIDAALRGMAFIDTVLRAADSDRKWHALSVRRPIAGTAD
jgi:predicted dehydrogenase